MKTTINSIKMMMITLTAISFLSFTTANFSSEVPIDRNATGLHFVGKVENQPLFRLVLNSEVSADYVVKVKEANGEIIFSEKLKGGSITRIYQLNTENSETISGTTFEVTDKATNKTTVYTISNLSRTIDDITVAEL